MEPFPSLRRSMTLPLLRIRVSLLRDRIFMMEPATSCPPGTASYWLTASTADMSTTDCADNPTRVERAHCGALSCSTRQREISWRSCGDSHESPGEYLRTKPANQYRQIASQENIAPHRRPEARKTDNLPANLTVPPGIRESSSSPTANRFLGFFPIDKLCTAIANVLLSLS